MQTAAITAEPIVFVEPDAPGPNLVPTCVGVGSHSALALTI
jgi:hypothetical protein